MIAYKYRGGFNFSRDLESIGGDYFYAARLDQLNDPFEATYSTTPADDFLEAAEVLSNALFWNREGISNMRASFQEVLSKAAKVGIFSLAERFDDMKLWAHYAGSHTGFCVGYDVETLREFNGDAYHSHNLLKVKYAEEPEALGLFDVLSDVSSFLQKVVGTKHPDWAHEAETRIISDNAGQMPHDFRAIKSIYFGLNTPPEQVEEVMKRMQGRQIDYYKMQRSTTAYELKAVPVPDLFPDAPRYLYHVSPVTAYALTTDGEDEDRVPLLPYLRKAVEIQRRDPYCSEVDYAGASTDKTKAGQIWVNYRYKGNYFNRHFTKAQIEELYAQITDLEA